MSRSIFIVGSLLCMAIAFSYGLPQQFSNGYSEREWSSASNVNPPSPNEQCRNRKAGSYSGACKVSSPIERCRSLKCVSNRRGDVPSAEDSGPALDYTWCGPGMVCFEGSCFAYPTSSGDPYGSETYEECQ